MYVVGWNITFTFETFRDFKFGLRYSQAHYYATKFGIADDFLLELPRPDPLNKWVI